MLKLREGSRGINVGSRIGKLVILGQQFRISIHNKSGTEFRWYVVVQCDCGTIAACAVKGLLKAATKEHSCGCVRRSKGADRNWWTKHSASHSKLYFVWRAMRNRCYGANAPSAHRYRDRGITVCDAWRDDFTAFSEWALANGYREGLTLDRVDNDGNYEPSNCRWVTQSENSRNHPHHTKRAICDP